MICHNAAQSICQAAGDANCSRDNGNSHLTCLTYQVTEMLNLGADNGIRKGRWHHVNSEEMASWLLTGRLRLFPHDPNTAKTTLWFGGLTRKLIPSTTI